MKKNWFTTCDKCIDIHTTKARAKTYVTQWRKGEREFKSRAQRKNMRCHLPASTSWELKFHPRPSKWKWIKYTWRDKNRYPLTLHIEVFGQFQLISCVTHNYFAHRLLRIPNSNRSTPNSNNFEYVFLIIWGTKAHLLWSFDREDLFPGGVMYGVLWEAPPRFSANKTRNDLRRI